MAEKEYIEREAAWNSLNEIGGCGAEAESWADGWDKAINAAIRIVEQLPSADVSPVRHGYWIEQCEESLYSCSACGAEWATIEGTPKENDMDFCPHCGAKMDEKERDENA